jgi:hypothetical protein
MRLKYIINKKLKQVVVYCTRSYFAQLQNPYWIFNYNVK